MERMALRKPGTVTAAQVLLLVSAVLQVVVNSGLVWAWVRRTFEVGPALVIGVLLFMVAFTLTLAWAILAVIVAVHIGRRRRWARVIGIVLGALMCFGWFGFFGIPILVCLLWRPSREWIEQT